VDGRYRVSCACISFLHAIKYSADMDHVIVAVHDTTTRYNTFGRYGEQLETIANVLNKESELWLFQLKRSTTEEDIYINYGEKTPIDNLEEEDVWIVLVRGMTMKVGKTLYQNLI